ncbi:MAG: monomethylamine:corrinoid methyltransferase [Nitrososphaerota archaeon]
MDFTEVLKRSETGPMTTSEDFLLNRVSKNALQLSREVGLRFDPTHLVNQDNEIVDKLFQAGFSLLEKTGVYCASSRRIIEFSRKEMEEHLSRLSGQVPVGKGKDFRVVRHRGIEDSIYPTVFGGPFNCDTDEKTFVKFNEAYALEPLIDVLFFPGYLKELDGLMIRPGSGLSTRAAILYGMYSREAIMRAGRPDMPIAGHAVMALNEIACSSEEWGLRKTDPRAMVLISELQVDDVSLTRMAYYRAMGVPTYMAFTPLIGGYGGGPEGTAVVAVASFIAATLLGGEIIHIGPQHIKLKVQTGQHSLWLSSIANQAIARNTKIVATTSHTTAGRPGSLQFPLEFSALAIASVVSGSNISGPRPAEPLGFNQNSPLMCRLFAEIGRASTFITREKANEIVIKLYNMYRENLDLRSSSKGQSFNELYDLDKLEPKEEHYQTYLEAKNILLDLGLPLNKV